MLKAAPSHEKIRILNTSVAWGNGQSDEWEMRERGSLGLPGGTTVRAIDPTNNSRNIFFSWLQHQQLQPDAWPVRDRIYWHHSPRLIGNRKFTNSVYLPVAVGLWE
jgi:hypothetical protein